MLTQGMEGGSSSRGLEDIIRAAAQMAADASKMPNTYQWGRRAIDWTGVPDEEGISGGSYLSPEPYGSVEEILQQAGQQPEFEPGPWDYHPNMSALRAELGRPSTWEEREPGLGRGPEESLWDLYQRKQAELHNPVAPPAGSQSPYGDIPADILKSITLDPNATIGGPGNPEVWMRPLEDSIRAAEAPPPEWGAAGGAVYALLDLLPYILAGA